jgi:hypothetical protein
MDRHGLKHSTLKWNRFEYHSNIVKKISRKEQISSNNFEKDMFNPLFATPPCSHHRRRPIITTDYQSYHRRLQPLPLTMAPFLF